VHRLRLAVPRVVVVGPAALGDLVPTVTVVPDRAPGLGPLGGLATALEAVDAPWLVLVACDMPFVAAPLRRALLAAAASHPEAAAVVPRTARGLEPLHAVYARACAPTVAAQLARADYALHALLAHLPVYELPAATVVVLDPQGLSTFNANTPAAWQRALRLATAESSANDNLHVNAADC